MSSPNNQSDSSGTLGFFRKHLTTLAVTGALIVGSAGGYLVGDMPDQSQSTYLSEDRYALVQPMDDGQAIYGPGNTLFLDYRDGTDLIMTPGGTFVQVTPEGPRAILVASSEQNQSVTDQLGQVGQELIEDVTTKTEQLKVEVNRGQKSPQEATNELKNYTIERTQVAIGESLTEEQERDIALTAQDVIEQVAPDVWEQMVEDLIKRLSAGEDREATPESTTTPAEAPSQ